jgi:hypothetical protein
MIRPSKDGTKLWFLPPEKSMEQELEFDLVYTHTCPKCLNLVQALFMTDKKIDPKPWEEIMTKQLDAQGHFKRIIPGRQDRFRSRYNVHVIGRGSSVSAELIRFTEHFDRKEPADGTAICNFMAVSSVIPEYRVYDMLLAQGLNPAQYKIEDKYWEDIKEKLLHSYAGTDQYAFVDAVGKGPECVLMSRTAYNWYMNEAVGKYAKPYAPPVQQNNW